MFNDEKTSLEFVMDVLREHVGLDVPHARYLMYRVHLEGSCVVATREQSDAEEIATKITNAAREKKFPLRVTTEPAT